MPRTAIAAAAALLTLGGCTSVLQNTDSFLGVITPYRIDIVQGNVVTKEQLALLKPGLSRNQVRELLGSPLLADVFHANRWDYLFTLRQPGKPVQRRSIVLTFDGDVLRNIEAPELPTENEFVAAISAGRPAAKPRVLELSEEERKALPVPARPAAPLADAASSAAAPAAPARSYPPLEPR